MTRSRLRESARKKSYFNVKKDSLWKKTSIFFHFCRLKSKSDFRIRLNASFRVQNPGFSSRYGVVEKIQISHHLAVITVFRFTSGFLALPVSRYLRNPYESLAPAFSYVLQKSLGRYLQSPRRSSIHKVGCR